MPVRSGSPVIIEAGPPPMTPKARYGFSVFSADLDLPHRDLRCIAIRIPHTLLSY